MKTKKNLLFYVIAIGTLLAGTAPAGLIELGWSQEVGLMSARVGATLALLASYVLAYHCGPDIVVIRSPRKKKKRRVYA